jgi:hypothetical protein
MAENKIPGSDKAWSILAKLDPAAVCRAGAVSYDEASGSYTVRSFGRDVTVSPQQRSIAASSPESGALIRKLGYFFDLSVLWYLVSAKDLPQSGRLVKLQNMQGGEIFTKGSHVLPLDHIADQFGTDRVGFLERGLALGGNATNLGDASLELHPFPRVPAVLVLWLKDEEFPARADLLFDSTCSLQVPMDILWSIAMMTVLVMK